MSIHTCEVTLCLWYHFKLVMSLYSCVVNSYLWGHFILVTSLHICEVTLCLWYHFILVMSLYACDVNSYLWCHFIFVRSLYACDVTLYLSCHHSYRQIQPLDCQFTLFKHVPASIIWEGMSAINYISTLVTWITMGPWGLLTNKTFLLNLIDRTTFLTT